MCNVSTISTISTIVAPTGLPRQGGGANWGHWIQVGLVGAKIVEIVEIVKTLHILEGHMSVEAEIVGFDKVPLTDMCCQLAKTLC